MNYLTNYYKNLSEQLESEVFYLQSLIEAKIRRKKRQLDPVGKEDSDLNNDGKVNKSDKYLARRRAAIAKALGRKKLAEAKNSDKEIKKRADEEYKKIRQERAQATHCSQCNEKLWSTGGEFNSGLCSVCARDHYN